MDGLLEVIFGALYHRLLLHTDPLDERYAHLVADTVLTGCARQPGYAAT